MKRLFDIVMSGAGLIVLAPILLIVAAAVKLSDGGAVLFKQERAGRSMKPFRIFKFRTMVEDADRVGPAITSAHDDRITPLGAFLRRSKLDELPQLFNVLRGEMSLVGPRPELLPFVRLYENDFKDVLRVRPGITDVASITYRNESDLLGESGAAEDHYVKRVLPDKLRLSKNYVERASFLYDIKLLCQTVLILLWPSKPMERLFARLGRFHGALTMAVQGLIAIVANVAAFWLRFEGPPPADVREVAARALPMLVLVRSIWFLVFRLDRDLWQYVGVRELARIGAAVLLGSASLALLASTQGLLPGYPRSVVLLDALVCMTGLIGVRVLRRLHREIRNGVVATRRVLLVGTGDHTERVLRELLGPSRTDVRVVGLVAQDLSSVGLSMHCVPILGSAEQLEDIVREQSPDEVVVVASDISAQTLEDTIRRCRGARGPVRVIPGHDGIQCKPEHFSHVEDPEAEELLFRDPVHVDWDHAHESYRGRRLLVTGAGGSIGSEIARQLAACEPARLVLFEKHEESLYHIDRELRARYPNLALEPVLGDIRDVERVEMTFADTKPEIIFHTAAYKHVPMLERNPIEALKTNALGTRILAEAAGHAGVERFVNISTDKAVEPVSALGVSKRMAELMLAGLAGKNDTRYMTVRFGNVLESSGSVVPLFREQIQRGGPVTVTHSEATRWFMTVPEAVQLILEAATLGRGGEVFVLDMGKPVRIVDLAHALIRRYGFRPDREIPVVFTGLRPGERLFEKLFHDHETIWKTSHPRILMAADKNGDVVPRRQEEFNRLMRFFLEERDLATTPDAVRLAHDLEQACA
ncbi:MAG TPA: polysaccharide biosynthesis protein [Candidatus Eisenbacteria bacterium]|jgi:FlaA1/EpsC-like NDP-sugar epimerase/lipopolysaccharide/colanic/teichoic acid biosynthesis glycosyltransferase|nr:polysaccharide biosynthesis protein [Candidatus Eisenbacteria bacterium]